MQYYKLLPKFEEINLGCETMHPHTRIITPGSFLRVYLSNSIQQIPEEKTR